MAANAVAGKTQSPRPCREASQRVCAGCAPGAGGGARPRTFRSSEALAWPPARAAGWKASPKGGDAMKKAVFQATSPRQSLLGFPKRRVATGKVGSRWACPRVWRGPWPTLRVPAGAPNGFGWTPVRPEDSRPTTRATRGRRQRPAELRGRGRARRRRRVPLTSWRCGGSAAQ